MSKVWVVTGCSTGLGRHLAEAILAKGDKLVATARDSGSIQDLAANGAAVLQLDVTHSLTAIKQQAHNAIDRFGHVDVLVNNAGMCKLGAVEDATPEDLFAHLNTNLVGAFKVAKAFLPHFRERKAGTIVNISSTTAFDPSPTAGLYAASKNGLEALMDSLRVEVKSFGIKILTVNPASFLTEIFASRKQDSPSSQDYAMVNYVKDLLINKFESVASGDPKKFAKLVVDVVHGGNERPMPERLLVGSEAYQLAERAWSGNLFLIKEWEVEIKSADLDGLNVVAHPPY